MKQKETTADLNGIDQKVVYRSIQTDAGVVYEGLLGKLPFSFSRKEDNLVFSDSLEDVSLRKAVITAVLDNEDRTSAAASGGNADGQTLNH